VQFEVVGAGLVGANFTINKIDFLPEFWSISNQKAWR
jgi:hypothetical protein